jgi:hypothetical protein
MTESILGKIEVATKSLLQENLRGQANIIARTYPLITEALSLGYRREKIYEVMHQAGLTLTQSSYVNALHRVKVAIETGKINLHDSTPKVSSFTAPSRTLVSNNVDTESQTQATVEKSQENESTSTATHLADSLKESVTVGQKDYSKIALQKLKQGNRSL